VGFYNVENLFDIVDDKKIMDEDFTPEGKNRWTSERYKLKLNRIAEVIDSMPGVHPAFMGLCEIENKSVLDDLVKEPKIANVQYAIIHQDSPDERGIDVAAIYNPKVLEVVSFKYTTVRLPNDADPNTRDLLYVKAKFNGEIIHLYVNHWPSRGGGQTETEPMRVAVANVLEMQIGNVLKADKNANILVMGDFNDFPSNKSISQTLNAGTSKENVLFNYMTDDEQHGEGSYFYKGEWGPLDQFMASKALHQGNGKLWADDNAANFWKNDLVLFNSKDGKRPNRTYVGEDYKGGYSDHLPIYIEVKYK
jgi:predicted extracellular nuclease